MARPTPTRTLVAPASKHTRQPHPTSSHARCAGCQPTTRQALSAAHVLVGPAAYTTLHSQPSLLNNMAAYQRPRVQPLHCALPASAVARHNKPRYHACPHCKHGPKTYYYHSAALMAAGPCPAPLEAAPGRAAWGWQANIRNTTVVTIAGPVPVPTATTLPGVCSPLQQSGRPTGGLPQAAVGRGLAGALMHVGGGMGATAAAPVTPPDDAPCPQARSCNTARPTTYLGCRRYTLSAHPAMQGDDQGSLAGGVPTAPMHVKCVPISQPWQGAGQVTCGVVQLAPQDAPRQSTDTMQSATTLVHTTHPVAPQPPTQSTSVLLLQEFFSGMAPLSQTRGQSAKRTPVCRQGCNAQLLSCCVFCLLHTQACHVCGVLPVPVLTYALLRATPPSTALRCTASVMSIRRPQRLFCHAWLQKQPGDCSTAVLAHCTAASPLNSQHATSKREPQQAYSPACGTHRCVAQPPQRVCAACSSTTPHTTNQCRQLVHMPGVPLCSPCMAATAPTKAKRAG